MINTKIHKATFELAEKLLEANRTGKHEQFAKLLVQLEAICTENEDTEKDHPQQWETLADFTADYDEAFALYEKALAKATDINNKDYMASISFSIARLHLDLEQTQQAITHLENAKISANKIADKDFKHEINELLEELAGE